MEILGAMAVIVERGRGGGSGGSGGRGLEDHLANLFLGLLLQGCPDCFYHELLPVLGSGGAPQALSCRRAQSLRGGSVSVEGNLPFL